jgi:hypothetical protein
MVRRGEANSVKGFELSPNHPPKHYRIVPEDNPFDNWPEWPHARLIHVSAHFQGSFYNETTPPMYFWKSQINLIMSDGICQNGLAVIA